MRAVPAVFDRHLCFRRNSHGRRYWEPNELAEGCETLARWPRPTLVAYFALHDPSTPPWRRAGRRWQLLRWLASERLVSRHAAPTCWASSSCHVRCCANSAAI